MGGSLSPSMAIYSDAEALSMTSGQSYVHQKVVFLVKMSSGRVSHGIILFFYSALPLANSKCPGTCTDNAPMRYYDIYGSTHSLMLTVTTYVLVIFVWNSGRGFMHLKYTWLSDHTYPVGIADLIKGNLSSVSCTWNDNIPNT